MRECSSIKFEGCEVGLLDLKKSKLDALRALACFHHPLCKRCRSATSQFHDVVFGWKIKVYTYLRTALLFQLVAINSWYFWYNALTSFCTTSFWKYLNSIKSPTAFLLDFLPITYYPLIPLKLRWSYTSSDIINHAIFLHRPLVPKTSFCFHFYDRGFTCRSRFFEVSLILTFHTKPISSKNRTFFAFCL